jgi:hypothetical protein
VGWRSSNAYTCSEGLAWHSDNGHDWEVHETGIPHYLELVISFKGQLFAFGHEYSSGACAGVGSGNVYRSATGESWELVATLDKAAGHWMDVVATAESMIAFSASSTSGYRTWRSSDGTDWQRSPVEAEGRDHAGVLGTTVVVADATWSGEPSFNARASVDGGETWGPATYETDYGFVDVNFAARDGVLIAASAACCNSPNAQFGFALVSHDGLVWTPAVPLEAPLWDAVAIQDSFLAIGDRTTTISGDGLSWSKGPNLPPHDNDRYIDDAAGGPPGVIVITSDYKNAVEYDIRLWFAPADALERSLWTEPAPTAASAEIGVAYPAYPDYCPSSIRADGDVWVPVNGEDLSDYYSDEPGMFVMTSGAAATWTAPDGSVIPLVPTHPVPIDSDPGC